MTFTEKLEQLKKQVAKARNDWVPGITGIEAIEAIEKYSKLVMTLEFVVQLTIRVHTIVNGFTGDDEEECGNLSILLLERDKLINEVVNDKFTYNI